MLENAPMSLFQDDNAKIHQAQKNCPTPLKAFGMCRSQLYTACPKNLLLLSLQFCHTYSNRAFWWGGSKTGQKIAYIT